MIFQKAKYRHDSFALTVASVLIGSILLPSSALAAAKTSKIPHKNWDHASETAFSPNSNLGTLSTALRFVLVTGLHKNLSLLLLHDVKNQKPIQDVVKQHGMDKAQDAVVKAIRSAKNSHAAEWNEMLASIYKRHFSDEALQSIMTERETSPYFSELIEKQALIAAETQIHGKDIFTEAKADVLDTIAEASL
ncbi:MAG: hypothetical protein AB3N28_14960 [Kordiimonas sp.]